MFFYIIFILSLVPLGFLGKLNLISTKDIVISLLTMLISLICIITFTFYFFCKSVRVNKLSNIFIFLILSIFLSLINIIIYLFLFSILNNYYVSLLLSIIIYFLITFFSIINIKNKILKNMIIYSGNFVNIFLLLTNLIFVIFGGAGEM